MDRQLSNLNKYSVIYFAVVGVHQSGILISQFLKES